MCRVVGPPCQNSMVKLAIELPACATMSETWAVEHCGSKSAQTRSLKSPSFERKLSRSWLSFKLVTRRERGRIRPKMLE